MYLLVLISPSTVGCMDGDMLEQVILEEGVKYIDYRLVGILMSNWVYGPVTAGH